MIVELLKPWRRWDAGFRMEKTAGAAEMLIRRGIAKEVDGDQVKPKAAPKRSAKKAAPKKATTKKATPKRAVKKAAKSIGATKRATKKASQ